MEDSLSSLSRDIFSKTLLSKNYSKTPLQPKKNKPSNGVDYVFPPEFSTRLNPAGAEIEKTLEGFCKFSLDRACRVSNPREG